MRDACAQTAQFRAMGIISGANQHPKDVPFVCEFWWRTYILGTMSTRKTYFFAIGAVDTHCIDCTQQLRS